MLKNQHEVITTKHQIGKTTYLVYALASDRARNYFLCTTHYIRKTVLKELVLADLQRVLAYVKEHEQEFVRTAAECGEQAAKKALAQ